MTCRLHHLQQKNIQEGCRGKENLNFAPESLFVYILKLKKTDIFYMSIAFIVVLQVKIGQIVSHIFQGKKELLSDHQKYEFGKAHSGSTQ